MVNHSVLSETPWTVIHQTSQSMGVSRQEYSSGLPSPPPGDLPNPGIKPRSPTLQADSLPSEPPGKLKDPGVSIKCSINLSVVVWVRVYFVKSVGDIEACRGEWVRGREGRVWMRTM